MNSPSRARLQPRRAGLKACATLAVLLSLAACHAAPRPAVAPIGRQSAALTQLQHDIDALLAAPDLEHGSWGVLVKSLADDDTLYALNARKLMMPASDMKIVTLAAAAERLGWDYTYETRVLGVGAIDAGTLDGDLLVVGSGDPSIVDGESSAAPLFKGWADRLKATGVRAIAGRIISDDKTFDANTLGFGWSWDDLPDGYAAGVSALQFNENSVRVTIAPSAAAGDPAGVRVAPDGSGLVIRNLLKTAAPDTAASIETRRLPGSTRLELAGSVPLGSPPSIHTASVDNPTLFFVTALRNVLTAQGIDVRGPPVDIDEVKDFPSRDNGAVLVTYRSPPLSTLATRMMKLSQNLYAETLLKTMGAAAGTPTAEAGRAAIRSTLQGWGVPPSGLIQVDGSGLSRYNFVTPETLVTILTLVDRDERLRAPFEAALPIAGRDGTLAGRMVGTAAEGNARAKTGAMANVRATSGYVRTADGEPVVFSIIANNFEATGDVITQTEDRIIIRLAAFSRR